MIELGMVGGYCGILRKDYILHQFPIEESGCRFRAYCIEQNLRPKCQRGREFPKCSIYKKLTKEIKDAAIISNRGE